MTSHRALLLLFLLALGCVAQAAERVPLADFAKHQQFRQVKISPDGKHLAATSVINDRVALSIIDLDKMSGFNLFPRDDEEVYGFWWVSDERVLYSVTTNQGYLETPATAGELFSVNVDGSGKNVLFGYRASSGSAGSTGSHIQHRQAEYASAWMLDPLRDNDKEALIVVQRWNWSHVAVAGGESLHAEVRKIDVKTGKNRTIAVAPMTNAYFLADNKGQVRFVSGRDAKQHGKVYYRKDNDSDWELILDEPSTGMQVWPVAFNRNNDAAYFNCGGSKGHGGLCSWDVATRSFKTLWSGSEAGPMGYEWTFDEQDLFAIRSMPGRVAVTLLDKTAAEAQLLASLMGQFPGEDVSFSNASKDGKKVVVVVESDRNPGAFYLYDADTKKVTFLMARAPWVEPGTMASMEPFAIKARDGMALHGYLTRPPGQEEAKNLPMVVYVHGGPYEIEDTWGYDPNVQAMASRGYAVLQVNFRGSGGYGYGFVKAGYGEWGAKMQDDVTDATRWAVEQGVADGKRICIFGGSYGGYAALQGAVREPDLYRCTIGYAGVYDLQLMKTRGDIPQSLYGDGYLNKVLGTDDKVLAQRSPINQIDRIKADVMLIVGGEDKRVPPVHGENLRNALLKRGKNVEWLYQPSEGHGFYLEKNRTDMLEKLIAFLDKNIGSASTPVAAAE